MSWFDVDSAFAEMEALSRQVDALLGQGLEGRSGARFLAGAYTDAGFFEEGDELVWRADLPGASKQDIDVKLENGVLSVDAHRGDESFEGRTARHRERRPYELHRRWRLPDMVDPDTLNANFEDGVLTLRVRRQPKPEPRRIAVA